MKPLNQLPLITLLLLGTSFGMADSRFNKQHKVNKAYLKTMVISKSKKGDKNSHYIKIKNKKELKKALESGQLDATYSEKGAKNIYMDIKNTHLNKNDLKKLKEVNIRSNITGSGKVRQLINIKGLKLDTDKHINIGVNTVDKRHGFISSTTLIDDSQLGR